MHQAEMVSIALVGLGLESRVKMNRVRAGGGVVGGRHCNNAIGFVV